MPALLKCRLQMKGHGCAGRCLGDFRTEGPLDRVKLLAVHGGEGCHQDKRDAQYPFHCTATFFAALRSNSASIFSLILLCANSDATRIAFLIALALERPW